MGDGQATGEVTAQQLGRPLLAGGLLAGAGLVDVVSAYANTVGDPYVVQTARGMQLVDITGWAWLHVAVGALAMLGGLAVVTGRGGTVPAALVVAGLAVVVDLLLLPYAPIRALLVVALDGTAVRLLWRYHRADAARAALSAAGTPGRSAPGRPPGSPTTPD